jgi:hypothetical protein
MLAWHGRIGGRTAVVERRWISGSCAKIVCWQLVTHMTHSNTHVERDPIQYALETDWPVRQRSRRSGLPLCAMQRVAADRAPEFQQVGHDLPSPQGTTALKSAERNSRCRDSNPAAQPASPVSKGHIRFEKIAAPFPHVTEKLAFAKERAGDDRNADKAACPNREAFFAGRNQVPRGRHAST